MQFYFSVICLQECWISDQSDVCTFQLSGYDCLSQGKSSSDRGGLITYVWYNESIREAKQIRRQAERLWRKTGLVVHREMYVEKRDMVNALIDQEKTNHYQSIIAENQGNTKQLFSVVHLLLGKSKTKPLPSNKSASELCSLFADFFVEKISKIRNSFPAESNSDNPEVPESSSTMAFFKSVTVVEVTKLVTSMTNKSCELDPYADFVCESGSGSTRSNNHTHC